MNFLNPTGTTAWWREVLKISSSTLLTSWELVQNQWWDVICASCLLSANPSKRPPDVHCRRTKGLGVEEVPLRSSATVNAKKKIWK